MNKIKTYQSPQSSSLKLLNSFYLEGKQSKYQNVRDFLVESVGIRSLYVTKDVQNLNKDKQKANKKQANQLIEVILKKQKFLQEEQLFQPKNYFGGTQIIKLNMDYQSQIFNNLFLEHQRLASKHLQNSQETNKYQSENKIQSNLKAKYEKSGKGQQQNKMKKIKSNKILKENQSIENMKQPKSQQSAEKGQIKKHQRSASGISSKILQQVQNKIACEQNLQQNKIMNQMTPSTKNKKMNNSKVKAQNSEEKMLSQSQQQQTCLSTRENNFMSKNEIIDKINIQKYLSAPKNPQAELFTKKLTSFLTNGRCKSQNKSQSINKSNCGCQNKKEQKFSNIETKDCQYLLQMPNSKKKNSKQNCIQQEVKANFISPQFSEKYLAMKNFVTSENKQSFLKKLQNSVDNLNQKISGKVDCSSINKLLSQYGKTLHSRQSSQTKLINNSNIHSKITSPIQQQQLNQMQNSQNNMFFVTTMEKLAQNPSNKWQAPFQQIYTNSNTNYTYNNQMTQNFEKFYPTTSKNNLTKMNINSLFSVIKQQQQYNKNNQN